MLARFAYYFIILPISYLPLPILYVMTDGFFVLLITIIPYRKKVIDENLKNSFPDKSKKERNQLRRRFYRHFTDMLAEGVKNLSVSEERMRKRVKVNNPEIMEQLYSNNKNVILASGHFNNWEMIVLGQPLLFKHAAYGIGMPMTSAFWDKKINERRSRFGMKVLHAKNYKQSLVDTQNQAKALLVLTDQSPGDSNRSYWMDFLGQKTAVFFGTEQMAHEYNYAVVFYALKKVKRGHYSMELKLICKDAKDKKWGEITEEHTRLLENEIRKSPQYWLWSHKRWKRDVPDNIDHLRKIQREKFENKFKN